MVQFGDLWKRGYGAARKAGHAKVLAATLLLFSAACTPPPLLAEPPPAGLDPSNKAALLRYALVLSNQLRGEDVRGRYKLTIVEAAVWEQEPDLAREIAVSIEIPNDRKVARQHVARGYGAAGRRDNARRATNAWVAIHKAERAKSKPRHRGNRAKHGDLDNATKDRITRMAADRHLKRGNLAEARQAADRIKPEFDRDIALAKVAEGHARAGDLAGALATANAIYHDTLRASADVAIADGLAESGDLVAAWRFVDERLSPVLWPKAAIRVMDIEIAQGDAESRAVALRRVRHHASRKIRNENLSKFLSQIARRQFAIGDKAGGEATIDALKSLGEACSGCRYDLQDLFLTLAERRIAAGDVGGARASLEGAVAAVAALGDSRALERYVSLYLWLGDVEAARAAALRLKESEGWPKESRPRSRALHEIVQWQANRGDFDGALATAATLDPTSYSYAVRDIAEAAGKIGKPQIAFDLILRIAEADDRVGALVAVVRALP